ncbi:transketolase 2 isozyme [Salmonella enterica subsp. arizonae]|uniref:Transketolase 2 isozyme n=1 Tax=Salmonella enterica subsp. arizonae TaxID=59203 RepID=A0A379S111_SALER|nr:transketolase 2 isozyme [Salmonella enterica subsp. arizonae]
MAKPKAGLPTIPAKRFEAYHWHVVHDIDGHDPEAVKKAILEARSVKDKPSLIICRTVIGFGSPNKAGKEESHGAALGEEEVALTRQKLGWHHPAFEIPKEIYRAWDGREKARKRSSGGRKSLLLMRRLILSWPRSLPAG